MKTRLFVIALAATASLAACGVEEEPASRLDRPSQEAENRKAMLDYARCMRENGVDMPDPKFDGRPGDAGKGPGKTNPDEMRTPSRRARSIRDADQAARALRRGEGGVQAGGAGQRALHARARHREVPGPDVRRERRCADPHEQGMGINPESAKFQAAQKACESTMPGAGTTSRARTSDEARARRRRRARGRRPPVRVVVLGGGEDPARRPPRPRPGRPRRSSDATSSTARTSPGRSATPTPARWRRGVSGTLTGLREPGAVVTRGHSLVLPWTASRRAFLLYGALPAWRDFASGMTDGEDVRQLERNLRALGYDPGDGRRRLGLGDDRRREGVPARPRPGRRRHARARRDRVPRRRDADRRGQGRRGRVGRSGPAGRRRSPRWSGRSSSSSTRARQHLARRGDKVTVELPTGRRGRGRITVGRQGREQGGRGERPDRRRHDHAARPPRRARPGAGGRRLRRRAPKGALAVPVKALLARQGGGYALELPGGRKVPVEAGLYADDMVEVAGDGVREGRRS